MFVFGSDYDSEEEGWSADNVLGPTCYLLIPTGGAFFYNRVMEILSCRVQVNFQGCHLMSSIKWCKSNWTLLLIWVNFFPLENRMRAVPWIWVSP